MGAMKHYLAEMVQQYVETALWSSPNDRYELDEGYGEMLDADFDVSDVDDDTVRQFEQDCAAFFDQNADDLAEMGPGQAGHDFWLTRNHHGDGFWDRGLGERGDRLTDAAHAFGEVALYVGDDGRVHA
jgi:hypothetical protein